MPYRPQYNATHAATSRRMRADHVARYGWMCPGDPDLDHPMHETRDLVADHIVAGDPSQGYRIACRVLNSLRGNAATTRTFG